MYTAGPHTTLKVGLNRLGGYRNEVVFVLTGLDIEAKAALVRDQMEAALDAAKSTSTEVRWDLARTDHPDAPRRRPERPPAPRRT